MTRCTLRCYLFHTRTWSIHILKNRAQVHGFTTPIFCPLTAHRCSACSPSPRLHHARRCSACSPSPRLHHARRCSACSPSPSLHHADVLPAHQVQGFTTPMFCLLTKMVTLQVYRTNDIPCMTVFIHGPGITLHVSAHLIAACMCSR